MDDIFISYANEDKARVLALAQALEARGFSVWFDRDIPPGATFDDVIEKELNAARCVVVVWTEHSVKSRWVRTEASAALDRNRLVPTLLDAVPIPLEFRRVQAANLTQWRSGEESEDFERLVGAIRDLLGGDRPPAPAVAVHTPAAVSRRVPWLAIGGLVVVAAAIATWMALPRSTDAPPPLPVPIATAHPAAPTQADAPIATVPVGAPAAAEPRAQPAASPAAAGVAPASAGAIAIAIGDPIDEGVPAPGAGTIAAAYAQTVYVFDAAPRETVFCRVRAYESGMSGVRWRLADSAGKEVFSSCLGCGDPGVVELRLGGRYTLTVGGGDPATGTYSLRLTRVPPPDRFAVELGSQPIRIAEGVPEAGAGAIEVPGARDLYTFSAPPKALAGFYVDSFGKGMNGLRLRLLDSDGEEVFASCLGCSNPGVVQLRQGGAYTLSVGGNADPATGPYAARIVSVPPPTRFDLGELNGVVRIAPGVPAAGAGETESPGAFDIYAFTVPPRARVAVRIVGASRDMSGIGLRIADADDNEIGASCLGCGDPGALDLPQGGTYTAAVGSKTDPATGTYELEIGRLH